MKYIRFIILCFAVAVSSFCKSGQRSQAPGPDLSSQLSPADARRIGHLIWHNESRGELAGLTSWNALEEFASLGIAHFIWYPAGVSRRFKETFPAFLQFAQAQGHFAPAFIRPDRTNPWQTRADFYRDFQTPQMQELRQFLARTVDLQTRFILRRLDQALPVMLGGSSREEGEHILRQFARLARDAAGIYALADYVNFKGEGIYGTELYQGQGWGLKQVLMEMRGYQAGTVALADFVFSARKVLQRRVQNSPPERREERYMAGWSNRLNTYLDYHAGSALPADRYAARPPGLTHPY